MTTVQRAELFGAPIDLLTMGQTVSLINEAIVARRRLHHVALNVAKLITIRSDQELREDVLGADIVGADGAGIVFSARIMGVRIPERVAGVDLMMETLALCERSGFRPYFLGATDAVVQAAVTEARRRWPILMIAGAHHGYFTRADEPQIVGAIKDSKADCLFVGIPSPLKERFCHAYRDSLEVPFIMGVGGSFDILAGKTARAPVWLQRMGLEWAYRLLQEPRRMWRRYLFTNSIFALMMFKALLSRRREKVFLRSILEDR